jgi:hypothetical protein
MAIPERHADKFSKVSILSELRILCFKHTLSAHSISPNGKVIDLSGFHR